MKSILQNIALISSILLIVSCSGGGGNSENPGIEIPDPQNGVNGQAVKGVVVGGGVTVTDGAGAAVPFTGPVVTGADGGYNGTFTPAAVTAGITGPLVLTVDGTGATARCDFDEPGTDDDCPVGDGTFATFGDDYALPDGFALRGVIPDVPKDGDVADPIVTVNISPASDVAFGLNAANTGALTSEAARAANAQVMGIIASITGISFTGQKLNELELLDLTDPASVSGASPQSVAISSFGAAVIGAIDATNTTIEAVIANIVASVSIDDNGNVLISGNDLADITEQVSAVLGSPALSGNTAAQQALQTANQNSALFRLAGDDDVTISQAEESTDTTSGLSLTKSFIAKLINIINGITATTGAGGIGVTGGGATEVFADALKAADDLSSVEVTEAYQQLEAALVAAEAELAAGGSTTLSGNGVSGAVSKSEDGLSLNLDNVSSVWTNATTGISAGLTITAGERRDEGATGTFSATGVVLEVVSLTESTDGTDPVVTPIQTFNGNTTATFLDEGPGLDLGLKTLDFDGSITTTEAPGTFTVELGLTEIEGTSVQLPDNEDGTTNNPDVTGKYTAKFGFGGLTASFAGDIGANVQTYAISFGDGSVTGTDTVMGSVSRVITTVNGVETVTDTNVITDGSATLTLEFTFLDGQAGQLTGPAIAEEGSEEPAGELTSGPTTALDDDGVEIEVDNVFGTVDANGVVRYSDGSVQSLPAAIN